MRIRCNLANVSSITQIAALEQIEQFDYHSAQPLPYRPTALQNDGGLVFLTTLIDHQATLGLQLFENLLTLTVPRFLEDGREHGYS